MRIVIDMQGAQTPGSRQRGIGRYTQSLIQAIVRQRAGHEIILALNGLFPETIAPLRAAFGDTVGQENIRVWRAPGRVYNVDPANEWRRGAAQLLREAFLASLNPDFVLVTSLFEGLGEDAVTSVGMLGARMPTAVVLYDLIPLIQRVPYLENPVVEGWYENKLDSLRRADLLLSISESSRQEGIIHLNFAPDDIVNISTAADPHFYPRQVGAEAERALRAQFGIKADFVMYTGGIDHRKNLEGLIRAYALLPAPLRAGCQLAIVCSIQAHNRTELASLAREHGLAPDELVLTGFVSEQDLTDLYNLCTVFVFPSWHEGFGLPALEAMSCGRAVIGANTSSLPEVIGRADALFDPRDDGAMAAMIERVLCDSAFRAELERHGPVQARLFSWDESARRALAAMQAWLARQPLPAPAAPAPASPRPLLAYLSPLPPSRSGIADYSAELLPELARHYQIDVIAPQEAVSDPWVRANCRLRSVQWLRENASRYDRVLYHFGNSDFHQHMFDLLDEVPGVIVLHDFYLSGAISHRELTRAMPGCWSEALYTSHGYAAVQHRFQAPDPTPVQLAYPCNLAVLRAALGVIVHAPNSLRLAQEWIGPAAGRDWHVIPHLRVPESGADRSAARRQLGLSDDAMVVCSFGLIGPTKLNHRLLAAWAASALARDRRGVLVFVGQNEAGQYGADLVASIARLGLSERVRISGWADMDVFRQYLAAADIGVQLRTLSRGETSGTVLDCMNYGLATIVNANGGMADLSGEHLIKLADEFDDADLVDALERLAQDHALRTSVGQRARELIRTAHSPRRCADQYAQAIEASYRAAQGPALSASLARVEPAPADEGEWVRLADAMAVCLPMPLAKRQWLVDVTGLTPQRAAALQLGAHGTLAALLAAPPPQCRIEPIRIGAKGVIFYARSLTLQLLGCPADALADQVADIGSGDLLLVPGAVPPQPASADDPYQRMRDGGVLVKSMEDAQW